MLTDWWRLGHTLAFILLLSCSSWPSLQEGVVAAGHCCAYAGDCLMLWSHYVGFKHFQWLHPCGSTKKPGQLLRSLLPSLLGVCVGIFIGVSFMKFGASTKLGSHGQLDPEVADLYSYRPPAPMVTESSAVVTCPSWRPRGTESLPGGIVAAHTDLYPRRLWGKPEEDLPEKPKYLLTFTVGIKQKEYVDLCIKKFSKEWQILLFHYDGHVNEWDDLEWSKHAIHISTRQQAKWWYAKRFLHPDVVEPYEYIFIWDEDLDIDHFDGVKYIELIKKFGLEISQPGLEPDGGLTWQMTKRLGNSEVHKDTEERPNWCPDPHKPPCAGFVEIMAPVFSRTAWRCVWHLIQNDLVHGWGLDFSLQRCAEPAHEKIGVVDAQWIRHRVVPSLGQSGEEDKDKDKPAWAEVGIDGVKSTDLRALVRQRCQYEWKLYTQRLELADEEQETENLKEARPDLERSNS